MHDPSTAGLPTQAPKGALRVIFLIVFMDLLGFGVIIPLLPFYARKFDASSLGVTALFSIYSICQFIAAPILGALSDRFGRRPVLILSQIGSVLGYLLLGVVTMRDWANPTLGLWLVYFSRIIDGLSGGNISTAQAYISDVTTPENRAKGMGLLGVAFGVGFAAGPALGGLLGHWHVSYPAYAAAIFSTIAAIMTFYQLPESRIHKPVTDEVWLHPKSFAPVLRSSVLLQLLLISFVCGAAFVMMESCIAMFLEDRFSYGPLHVAAFFAYLGVLIVIVQGGLIGRLTRLIGEWPLSIIGPAAVAAGMLCFVEAGYRPVLLILLIGGAFNAAGRSFWQPSLSSLLSKFTDRDQQGVVFGLFHGLGSIARVVGPIVAGSLYERKLGIWPFAASGAILLIATIWTGALAMAYPRPHHEAVEATVEPL